MAEHDGPEEPPAQKAETVEKAPRRFPLRSWIKQGLAALVVLAIAQVLYIAFVVPEDQWHAELRLADYDCHRGRVCTFKPHIDRVNTDANGARYRVTTNGEGLRGRDHPVEKSDPATYRIAVFGSSPVFGLGVNDDETLPVQLARALAAELPAAKLEVMNFGLPETYLLSEIDAYEAIGRAYRPDLVVFVQPEAVRIRDMNWRVLQIHGSPFMQWLLKYSWGRRLVNRYQNAAMRVPGWVVERVTPDLVRARMQVFLDDQRARGTDLLFYQFWGDFDAITNVIPDGLRYGKASEGASWEEFLRSELVIPRDGHPNAAGHRYYGARLSEIDPIELR